MFDLFRLWCGAIVRTFRSRRGLMLENLALRQQLAVLKRIHPRPKLGPLDKLFWVVALRVPMERNNSFSFCQKRWSAGTGLDSEGIGRCCAKRENESAVAGESNRELLVATRRHRGRMARTSLLAIWAYGKLAAEYKTILPDEELIAEELERSRRELEKRCLSAVLKRRSTNLSARSRAR